MYEKIIYIRIIIQNCITLRINIQGFYFANSRLCCEELYLLLFFKIIIFSSIWGLLNSRLRLLGISKSGLIFGYLDKNGNAARPDYVVSIEISYNRKRQCLENTTSRCDTI